MKWWERNRKRLAKYANQKEQKAVNEQKPRQQVKLLSWFF